MLAISSFFKKKELVAVVIPIYKPKPDPNEVLSLQTCLEILTKYQIIFVAPENLNVHWYLEFCSTNGVQVRLERFQDNYFANISGYNKLLLSAAFYKRFLNYKYILIYQLDALVFRDELTDWCNSGIDYIGAPWPADDWPYMDTVYAWLPKKITWLYAKKIKKINLVGNGGLSLRHNLKFYLICLIFRKSIQQWLNKHGQEDIFWSFFAGVFYPFYKVGKEADAIRFAFEKSPHKLYRLNNNQLPFGCHAWEKHDPEFWQEQLKQSIDLHSPLLRQKKDD
ncbi:DUF5672 family protein [Xanthocytophaga agilis]|uniref:DUF5672 family protein n=1 Tax=Xanthocytophaga agilis TaxID=3048010 RepID=A0AAE3R1P2_9BACT|nr:DUF5672 family protein [Xanthocytophaga agilis]MDJ1502181.1 DUF5672 family protein [Xanthocytophaga agilis]